MAQIIKLITPVFRVSFPQVAVAKAMEEGQVPKFSVSAVWRPERFTPREKELWLAINNLCDEVALAKFKKKVADFPANFKKPIRDGLEKEGVEPYGPGTVFANLSSRIKPSIHDAIRGEPLNDPDNFYAGAWARATVTAYAYDNKGKGVALGLQSLQLVKEGPRIDARGDAAEDFAGAEDVDGRDFEDEFDPLA